jgi:rare lipoprotein A
VPDAVPRIEPLHPGANRPYRVFGVAYVPRPDLTEHRERGVASWYGRKFHGRRTSSGERYDMYAMTAAHPTLPIPSYVRVTHLRNGRSVVVRVNDRGPFLHRRVIDLSYTAAYRLGYVDDGHAEVEVELLASPAAAGRVPTPAPSPVPAPADVARAPGPPASSASSPSLPRPMLADAVAAERLSFETLVDDLPPPAGAEVSAGSAAVSTAAAPASGASRAAQERGTWLQIGAFASRDNAEAARALFSLEAPWLAVPIDVLRQGGTWRVQAGPWTSREDALAAAARIASNGVFRPIPVLR